MPKRQASLFGTCGIHALVSIFSFARAVLSIDLSLRACRCTLCPRICNLARFLVHPGTGTCSHAPCMAHRCTSALPLLGSPIVSAAFVVAVWATGFVRPYKTARRLAAYCRTGTGISASFVSFIRFPRVSPQTGCSAFPADIQASAYGLPSLVATLTAHAHRV